MTRTGKPMTVLFLLVAMCVALPPGMAQSVVKAVRQWKYKPYLLEGKPVEVDTEVRVNFALSGG